MNTPQLPPFPTDQTLHYLHVSHCTFAVSDGAATVLIDPFFSGQFIWKNQIERHLDTPALPLESFYGIDAILISHEHNDHYDPSTLQKLIAHTRAPIYAPRQVIDDAVKIHAMDAARFIEVFPHQTFNLASMTITVYPAASSEKTTPIDRVGFHIASGSRTLYHQGDSHGTSPAWAPMRENLDVFIMWPYRVLEAALILKPKTILFQHMDRFAPGNFFCNRSAELELAYHRHYHPTIRFVVPTLGQWEPVQ
jgi:L-ascorbate metabolism protein UlaG (beta-lactamase superfamily)